MVFKESAFAQIKETVGTLPPESGGLLLGNEKDFVVQKFIFDPNGIKSSAAYDPDVDFLNKKLKEERKNGLDLIGFAHSHPRGVTRLSGDLGDGIGDIGYIKEFFKAFPELDRFLAPIIFSTDNGNFDIFPYVAFRNDVENYVEANLIIEPDIKLKPIYTFDPSVLEGSVDYTLMQNAKVVCVGVGGANGICENLVRSGLGTLVLIDFDVVESKNLTIQGYFPEDVGELKVDALKNRLLRINPNLNCVTVSKDFTSINKDEMKSLVKDADLLLMMTDDFYAQAFGNKVALKYKLPAVFALMYEKARCSEITFSIPGVTPGCHRCATSSRYKAYQDGYKNDVTSVGSTIFHTYYLNSAIGMVSLAILHRSTQGYEFSNWFGSSWNRNLIQLRTHPSFGIDKESLFAQTFNDQERAVGFDAIWQKVEEESFPKYSEPCPDCGGIGDLILSAYFISLLQNPLFRKSDWLKNNNI